MNRQPYCKPPRWWPPKISPRWVRFTRGHRRRMLSRKQKIVEVRSQNGQRLREAVDAGHGVMLTPNHSVHYDSAALYLAADELNIPLFYLTAWQVFAMSSRFECWFMQRMGCFSIDRESNDRQAFKQALHVLQNEPHPLVVFPEGDVYHTNDTVMPFRDGAAAMALTAGRRAERPVCMLPVGIKFWYVDDPRPSLRAMLDRLEARFHLRRRSQMELPQRIYRLAEVLLAAKELDYLGQVNSGTMRERIGHLSHTILQQLEERHGLDAEDHDPPARVKALRQKLIENRTQATQDESDAGEESASPEAPSDRASGANSPSGADSPSGANSPSGADAPVSNAPWDEDLWNEEMDDLFCVMQLYSYPGDYLEQDPRVERMAETIDKFEEDVFGVDVPTVHGRRRVDICFGEPIAAEGRGRERVAELTHEAHAQVQGLIDGLNANHD